MFTEPVGAYIARLQNSYIPTAKRKPVGALHEVSADRRGYGFTAALLSLCDVFPKKGFFADPYSLRKLVILSRSEESCTAQGNLNNR